jgi:hypothetical protein
MSKRRFTHEVLAAGQLRPYADSIYRNRITFEWQGMEGFKSKDAPFIPAPTDNEDYVRRLAKTLSGWSEPTDENFNWASTKLDYLKPIEPHVWEWQTSEAYTD